MGGTPDQTYAEVVLGRRSIRGYLDKPVPRALIEEILEMAMRSPSEAVSCGPSSPLLNGFKRPTVEQPLTATLAATKSAKRRVRRMEVIGLR